MTSSGQSVFESTTADGTEFTTYCPDPVSNPTTGDLTGSVDASGIAGVKAKGDNESTGASTGEAFYLAGASSDFKVAPPTGTHRLAVRGIC